AILPLSPEPAHQSLLGEAAALARTIDNPRAVALGLEARYRAGWRLDNLRDRLRAGAELLEAARAAGDPDIEFLALWMRACDVLQLGDGAATDLTVAALGAVAERTRQARDRWIATGMQAALAILEGRLVDGDRLALRAHAVGRGYDPRSAARGLVAQQYLIR